MPKPSSSFSSSKDKLVIDERHLFADQLFTSIEIGADRILTDDIEERADAAAVRVNPQRSRGLQHHGMRIDIQELNLLPNAGQRQIDRIDRT